MPIDNETKPDFLVELKNGVIALKLRNFRIIFMNRVIKELQQFFKEVGNNFVKARQHSKRVKQVRNQIIVFLRHFIYSL